MQSRSLAAIGALAFLALVACASPPPPVTAQVSVTTPVVELSTALSWPDGYNQPTQLVADPDSTGVWWWSTSGGGSSLFHYVPDSGIRIQPIDSVAGSLPFTLDYGLAVTSTQVVLGTQREIVSLNRADDKLTRWNLREPADAQASTDSDLPSQILALAATDATVAVSVRDEPAIRVLDEKTGRFTQLPLPENAKAGDLAFDRQGRLAASLLTLEPTPGSDRSSLSASSVLLSADLATFQQVAANSEWLAAAGDDILIGGRSVKAVAADGGITQWGDPKIEVPTGVRGAYLSATKSALTAGGESVMMVGSGGETQRWNTPRIPCPTLVAPGATFGETETVSQPPATDCADAVVALAADGAGNIWGATTGEPGLQLLSLR